LAPAIGQDGTIYFSSNKYYYGTNTYLFAFNPETGVNKWYSSPTGGYSIPSSPLISGSNIFVAADAQLRAFDQLGNGLWGWTDGNNTNINYGFGAADSNGNLYFTALGKIYKIGN
jgi:outer membrane protein assembly factor BamB